MKMDSSICRITNKCTATCCTTNRVLHEPKTPTHKQSRTMSSVQLSTPRFKHQHTNDRHNASLLHDPPTTALHHCTRQPQPPSKRRIPQKNLPNSTPAAKNSTNSKPILTPNLGHAHNHTPLTPANRAKALPLHYPTTRQPTHRRNAPNRRATQHSRRSG